MKTMNKINWIVVFLSFGIASHMNADSITHGGTTINMDFVDIGYTNNVADTVNSFNGGNPGAVDYAYQIGTYEVTIDQFSSANIASGNLLGDGDENPFSIGSNGPASRVNWLEAAKFANWLTSGSYSNGAYQFSDPDTLVAVDRAAAALAFSRIYVLPTEDEWYKAAYFKSDGTGYTAYSTGDTLPDAEIDINYGGYGGSYSTPWSVGSGTAENNGTFDMNGNVLEWCETPWDGTLDTWDEIRVNRGASFSNDDYYLQSLGRSAYYPGNEAPGLGFRVAAINTASATDESIHYVDINNTSSTAPYTSWATAANSIQDAVDVSVSNDTVWVAGGTYLLSSAITVSSNILIRSVNGPVATIVDGGGVDRCFSLVNSECTISGFTIRNGYTTGNGAGVYCNTILPMITNCTITGNTAQYGGGLYYGTAKNCTISDNAANQYGGGMYVGVAINCTVRGNTANNGGGLYSSTAHNCSIVDNTALSQGGGMYSGTANNCTVFGNTANSYPGGMHSGTANNSIIWSNSANSSTYNDSYSGTRRYTCSPDLSPGVDGNITNAPLMIGASHIATNSPCRGAGSGEYATGVDVDGELWLPLPSMGCDENSGAGSVVGEVEMALAGPSSIWVGTAADYLPIFNGPVTQTIVDFGSGHVVTNPSTSFSKVWNSAGSIDVVLTAFNDMYPMGITQTQTIEVVSEPIYVSGSAGDDENDGSSWGGAKKTIQAGIDAQLTYGGRVLVADGSYLLNKEIVIHKAFLTVESENGPASTIIDGGGRVRCLNLGGTSCRINGFTLQNGYTYGDGGGVYCLNTAPVLSNCTVTASIAKNGGGVFFGTLSNCSIFGNKADERGGGLYMSAAKGSAIAGNAAMTYGGGLYYGTANNCTISGNASSLYGGGMYSGTADNSIIWYNTAGSAGNDSYSGTRRYTCASDISHGVDGNITNAPQLISSSHIGIGSPCLSAGTNLYASGVDIDGEPWQANPAMGCDEYVGSGSLVGLLSLSLLGPTSIVVGHSAEYLALVDGKVTQVSLDFGDGAVINPMGAITKEWNSTGTVYAVLSAYNDDYPTGLYFTKVISVVSEEDSTIFVSGTTGDDLNDGLSWGSAKKTIQAGIDAQATLGGRVLVDDGNYLPTSTLGIRSVLRLESLNGPQVTVIDGGGMMQCLDLGRNKSVVSGFSIQNGFTAGNGGGVLCVNELPVVTNCVVAGNVAGGYGGGIYYGQAFGCTLYSNVAVRGGGKYEGSVTDCEVVGNRAQIGGGLGYTETTNSMVSANNASNGGGGVYSGTAINCMIQSNVATIYGGGTYYVTVKNSSILGNEAAHGGGSYNGTIYGSSITGNKAVTYGGGVYSSMAYNCTITGNESSGQAGGMYSGTAYNCIIWHNTASVSENDSYSGTRRFTCSPDVIHGVDGNITTDPLLVSASHIAAGSPCLGGGDPANASGLDIDGQSWLNPPSMGCDEYLGAGTVVGEVDIALHGPAGIIVGLVADYHPLIEGPVTQTMVDFGNGNVELNPVALIENAWAATGTFEVVVTAYSDSYPGGFSHTQLVTVVTEEDSRIYVSDAGGDDANDGSGWASAKQTIQAGVDAQNVYGGTVLVADGNYVLDASVRVDKNLQLKSVNGAATTVMDGGGIVRCMDLGSSKVVVDGFTIRNGAATGNGGGVLCANKIPVLTNCVITANSATSTGGGMYRGTVYSSSFTDNSANVGGGLYDGQATDCAFDNNHATNQGGGMHSGLAYESTFQGNRSNLGAGTYNVKAWDSLFTENVAVDDGGGMYLGTASGCAVSNNVATIGSGGGLYNVSADDCVIYGNSANREGGGGMFSGTASECSLIGNQANSGGGMQSSSLTNCSVLYNSAFSSGGGTSGGKAINCSISGNTAYNVGGGVSGTITYNCTITGNRADRGGGMYSGTAYNSIIWHNIAITSYSNNYVGTRKACCSPDLLHGVDGNITSDPLLVSSYHIASVSPCIGTGINAFVFGTDIDGETWRNPPSMGCDEYTGAASLSGPVEMGTLGPQTIVVGSSANYLPVYEGQVTQTIIDFSDGYSVTNPVGLINKLWSATGIYDVVTTAFNSDYPTGISQTQTVQVVLLNDSAVYVSASTGNDANDGSSWADAMQTIQAGVDVQDIHGGLILVDDGTYYVASPVMVRKAVVIESRYRSELSIVDGGDTSQCFDLGASECLVSGFTIQNGYTSGNGGGVVCLNSTPVVTNCILRGNSATSGGGMYRGRAVYCFITENSASNGGGVYSSIADFCTFVGNTASSSGGAMYSGTANNGIFSGNSAFANGGAMASCTANNCSISGNTADDLGGGVYSGTANNCSIVGNKAFGMGGGLYSGSANNSIVWGNISETSDHNGYNMTSMYTCSPELVHGVDGNITNAPLLASASHVSSNSPCIGAGTNAFVSGVDIDGEPWQANPAMGCDEYAGAGSRVGDISIQLFGEPVIGLGFETDYTAFFQGAVSLTTVDFGDGTIITNPVGVMTQSWLDTGEVTVILTAYNDEFPDGISNTNYIQVVEAVVHVSISAGNDANDGSSWQQAKRTIQAGVDAQMIPGGRILVDDGVYQLTAEILVQKDVFLESVHGAEFTIIDGDNTVRCLNLGRSACFVRGFTLRNGYSDSNGGGVYCQNLLPFVSFCTITNNGAYRHGGGLYNARVSHSLISGNTASTGGGISSGQTSHCVISDNNAYVRSYYWGNGDYSYSGGYGGGLYNSSAKNCVISHNEAHYATDRYYHTHGWSGRHSHSFPVGGTGGGMSQGEAHNTILWENSARLNDDLVSSTLVYSYSKSTTNEVSGNITNAPVFVDDLNGNYRLVYDSPGIDAGNNGAVESLVDLDGNPRIINGAVDMGAYEYNPTFSDSDSDMMTDGFEQTYFGNPIIAVFFNDSDGDGHSDLEEFIAVTNPQDPGSTFMVTDAETDAGNRFVLHWDSQEGRLYDIYWKSNLADLFQPLEENIPYPHNSYTDMEHAVDQQGFYQLRVKLQN